jgi:hypothetical protein
MESPVHEQIWTASSKPLEKATSPDLVARKAILPLEHYLSDAALAKRTCVAQEDKSWIGKFRGNDQPCPRHRRQRTQQLSN